VTPPVAPFSIQVTQEFVPGASPAWHHHVFVKLYTSVLDTEFFRVISDRDWKTLCVIALHMNRHGQCYPSRNHIATVLHVDPSTASTRIQSLLAFRWHNAPLIWAVRERLPDGKLGRQHYTVLSAAPMGMGQPPGSPLDGNEPEPSVASPFAVEIDRQFIPGESPTWKHEIFVKLYTSALQSGFFAAISDRDWKTLCVIALHMNLDGQCYPTIAQIAYHLRVDYGTASKRVRSLLAFRWHGHPLICPHRPRDSQGRWSSQVYTILPLSLFGMGREPRNSDRIPALWSRFTSGRKPNLARNHQWSIIQRGATQRGATQCGKPQRVSKKNQIMNKNQKDKKNQRSNKPAAADARVREGELNLSSSNLPPSPAVEPHPTPGVLVTVPSHSQDPVKDAMPEPLLRPSEPPAPTIPGWTPADETALAAYEVSDADRTGTFAAPDPLMRWLCAALGRVQVNAADYRAVHEGWALLDYDALAVRQVAQTVLARFQPAYAGQRIQSCRYFLPAWQEAAACRQPVATPGTALAPRRTSHSSLTPRERNHQAALRVLAEMATEEATIEVSCRPSDSSDPGGESS